MTHPLIMTKEIFINVRIILKTQIIKMIIYFGIVFFMRIRFHHNSIITFVRELFFLVFRVQFHNTSQFIIEVKISFYVAFV